MIEFILLSFLSQQFIYEIYIYVNNLAAADNNLHVQNVNDYLLGLNVAKHVANGTRILLSKHV